MSESAKAFGLMVLAVIVGVVGYELIRSATGGSPGGPV